MLKCDGGASGQFFIVKEETDSSPTVHVFADGVEQSKTSGQFVIDVTGKQQLMVSILVNAASAPSVKLSIYAYGQASRFDECMQMKNCIAVLAPTDSAEGEDIRIHNGKQLQCLMGQMPASDADYDKCNEWKECTDGAGHTQQLIAILQASQPTSSSMALSMARRTTTQANMTKQTLCVNPSITDVESWDCSCWEATVEMCGDRCEPVSNPDCSTCVREIWCAEPRVCQSWKDSACSSGSSLAQRSANLVKDTEASSPMSLASTDETLVRKSGDC
jgi:hypothetical protein